MRIALFLLAFAAVLVVANPNIEERKKKMIKRPKTAAAPLPTPAPIADAPAADAPAADAAL